MKRLWCLIFGHYPWTGDVLNGRCLSCGESWETPSWAKQFPPPPGKVAPAEDENKKAS